MKIFFCTNARPNNVRKVQLVDFSDQWFVATFLTLLSLGGLHFDFRQIFSPAPPLDSSAARFRSRPARCAGLSRKELRYTNCRLPLRQLHVVICVLGAIKVFGLQLMRKVWCKSPCVLRSAGFIQVNKTGLARVSRTGFAKASWCAFRELKYVFLPIQVRRAADLKRLHLPSQQEPPLRT